MRCQSMTQRGTMCKREVSGYTKHCLQHQGLFKISGGGKLGEKLLSQYMARGLGVDEKMIPEHRAMFEGVVDKDYEAIKARALKDKKFLEFLYERMPDVDDEYLINITDGELFDDIVLRHRDFMNMRMTPTELMDLIVSMEDEEYLDERF